MKRFPRRRFLFSLIFVPILLAVTGLVYWLWNTVLVAVAPLRPVTYWQAMGLLVLSRILFGGMRFGRPGERPGWGGPPWREKWRSMTDEERESFKAEWRRRHHS
ncbi:hypothetical protein [Rudanella paleaurantiibacter]|uniref:hypothetical protein n=1 Tax=Rudanella paleaurantiibacter TaxID=2614655 RepID=UPI0016265579|nr:hypothetical protein [Rudanella paleaurantiibacter]